MTILQRIMRVHRAVVFRQKKGHYGMVWTACRDPMVINIALHERRIPSRTYLHECIHIICPTMPERDVRTVEKGIWERMTPHQRFLLARKLYSRKWRTG